MCILNLLEAGDSVMADKGFDIEDLIPIGAKLNIPPFLRGKTQFDAKELIETRRIASLRIHVERAMERIKNFHIFDRTLPVSLTDIADRMFCLLCIDQLSIPFVYVAPPPHRSTCLLYEIKNFWFQCVHMH